MKIKIFSVIFAILILITALTPSIKSSESIAEKVFRLHIIANSNSIEDQRLKLNVRNDILKNTSYLFRSVNDKEEAIKTAQRNITLIRSIAQKTVIKNGYNYKVNVFVDNEFFNTRKYENFILPAGKYDCLKIVIGEGKGHNFWCVLYPSVCVNSCSDEIEDVLNEEEIKLIKSKKYIIKFKAIEIYEKIKSKL
ncbi:MAG: stage II sporulation protein R [Eubacterium sp.]|nr:stage II sporulation protein R [Eubacterium sp.]